MSATGPSNARETGESGFTLLELLVTMTLLAMLSVAIADSVRYGSRIWHASEAAGRQDSQMLTAQIALKAMLETAYPAYTATTETDAHVEFDGRGDGFSLLTPDGNIPGGLSSVAVGSAQEQDGLALVSSAVPELGSDPPPAASKHVLLHNIRAVEFSYYGATGSNEGAGWYPSWHGKTTPPKLVRVRIQFAERTARAWPELIVAPRITADLKCNFDLLTKNCLGR